MVAGIAPRAAESTIRFSAATHPVPLRNYTMTICAYVSLPHSLQVVSLSEIAIPVAPQLPHWLLSRRDRLKRGDEGHAHVVLNDLKGWRVVQSPDRSVDGPMFAT